jgi:prepilin-type N-terminal cleavage/methylation domain-containing protein
MKINRQDAVDNRQGAKNAKKSFFLFPTWRPLRLGGLNSGFTMVEIAICLAVIGIALVSIIGVLPLA